MKMAKPSPADIEAGGELVRVLDLIAPRHYGRLFADEDAEGLDACLGEDGLFDETDRRHLNALHATLVRLLRKAPGFHTKIIGGMCYVICWEKNNVLDNSASTIELHPDILEGLQLLKAQREAQAREPAPSEGKSMDFDTLRQTVAADPAVSFALKRRLEEDMRRDPVDAMNDAELLHTLMERRLLELPGLQA